MTNFYIVLYRGEITKGPLLIGVFGNKDDARKAMIKEAMKSVECYHADTYRIVGMPANDWEQSLIEEKAKRDYIDLPLDTPKPLRTMHFYLETYCVGDDGSISKQPFKYEKNISDSENIWKEYNKVFGIDNLFF